MAERPWLKITFDSWLPGEAFVLKPGYKRRVKAPGQWLVFDKTQGVGGLREYAHGRVPVLFSSADIDECHRFIEAQQVAA